MVSIDSTARVAPGAQIGSDVAIGPYCVIDENVVIGDGCRLVAHVHITGHTTIGPGTKIAPFVSLGTPPQSTRYRGGPTRLVIGAGCDIRECVTMNRGTEDDRGVTEIGERCFFLASSHVGHDCAVGDDVTLANNAVLGGHVSVGDRVFIGGNSAVHQFVRIGESAMISGMCGIRADVIPFGFCIGAVGWLDGLNLVGLRRRNMSRSDMHRLRDLYQTLFHGEGQFAERLAAVAETYADNAYAMQIIDFIRTRGKRQILSPRSGRGEAAPFDAQA